MARDAYARDHNVEKNIVNALIWEWHAQRCADASTVGIKGSLRCARKMIK